MTQRTILPFGDSILRKKARPVTAFDEKLFKLLDDLADTLYAKEGRAGLASPQIGILRRVAVIDDGSGLIELINPEIVVMDGEQFGTEACLSFPGYLGNVKRAQAVQIRFNNRLGEAVEMKAEGFLARCIQHEIDHLDGILFIDHMKEPYLIHEKTKHRVSLMEAQRLTRA
ncbi:peptide deformylase [Paenibacillus aestuarii]|uniref:Peptide deformylase n=1 Tax=Paenibacillus aestuarii TaxID=516965 RepID=A0ABW0K3Z2_9BACL|nr:peptide deformylase [Paenibacillus aestuarii]